MVRINEENVQREKIMKRVKQTFAVFLALLMLITALPIQASAAKRIAAPSVSISTGDNAFTVSWKAVKGASAYEIYYTTDAKFKKGIKKTKTKKTKATIKKLKGYKKYYVRVKTCKGKKKKPASAYSKTVSVITNVRPTSIKSLTAGQASFSVKLGEAKNCKYQLQYATNSKFSGAKTVNKDYTNFAVTRLGNSTGKPVTVYVRVRSYRANKGKNVYTAWTGSKKVTTKQVTFPKAAKVDSVSTALSGTQASLTVNFFHYDGLTTAYRVQVATDNTFRNVVQTTKSVSSKSVTVSNLNQNMVYYFRVCSVRNMNGIEYVSAWAAPQDNVFKTGSSIAKDAPQNLMLNLTSANTNCSASWNTPSGTFDFISYVVQYSTSSAFPNEDYATTTINTTNTQTSFATSYNFNYFVRVKAVVYVGKQRYETPWSSVQSISVKNPYEITDSVKISSVTATKTSVTAQWVSIANATGYEIQLAANKDFTNSTTQKTSALNVTFNDLMDGTTYYVRVRAYNDTSEKTYYSSWTTQSVTTKSDIINEGVTYKYVSDGHVIPSKPCLYSQEMLRRRGYSDAQFQEYYRMLKSAYTETGVTQSMSDLNKVLLIGKWIGANVSYDTRAYNGSEKYYNTSYDALKYGLTVCQGYSWLLDDMCYLAGVPCYSVNSTKHEWNIVCIDNVWYDFDPTSGGGTSELISLGNPYGTTDGNIFKDNIECNEAIGPFHYIDLAKNPSAMSASHIQMIKERNLVCATYENQKALKPLLVESAKLVHDTNTVYRNKDAYNDDVCGTYAGAGTYKTPGKDIYIY